MYWFLGSLCQVVPEVAGEYVRKLSPLVLGSVDVLEPGLTGAVWDAVLSLIKFVPVSKFAQVSGPRGRDCGCRNQSIRPIAYVHSLYNNKSYS